MENARKHMYICIKEELSKTLQTTIQWTRIKIKKAQTKQIFLSLAPVNSQLIILYYIIILKYLKDFIMCKITAVLNVKD